MQTEISTSDGTGTWFAMGVAVAAMATTYATFRAYRALTSTKHKLPKQYSQYAPIQEEDGGGDEGGRIRVAMGEPISALDLAHEAVPHFRGVLTMWDMFENAAGAFADNALHGTFNSETQTFDYETYDSVYQDVKLLAQGMEELQLLTTTTPPTEGSGDKMRLFGIFGPNSSTWVKLDYASMSQGGTLVPLYATLAVDGITHVLRLTKVATVACLTEDLAKRLLLAHGAKTCLKTIVVSDRTPELVQLAADRAVNLVTVEEIRDAGRRAKGRHASRPPTPDTIWTFCFTSGSTGAPKGALISHRAISTNTVSLMDVFIYMEPGKDFYLSYLPLAHQLERTMVAVITLFGGRIAFSRGAIATLMDDVKILRPTFFSTVPRLLGRIAKGLDDKIASARPLQRALFNYAVRSKLYDLEHYGHFTHPIWDRIIFNKVRNQLGFDRVKTIGTGSAPISPQVLDRLRVILCFPVGEAYGQTEATCGLTGAHPLHAGGPSQRASHVGGPLRLVELKLESVPEMKYMVEDRLHEGTTPVMGRGEILARGDNLMLAYYDQPEKTREAIDAKGWLHTGDIGAWLPDGTLCIIDRKNNIFKTSVGEYVQLDKIERAICTCQDLVQACFVFGTTLNSRVVAVCVLAEGAEETSTSRDAVVAACREFGLLGFEIPGAFRFKKEVFTAESGVLTPTAKIVRGVAKEYFKNDIVDMYKELGEEVKI